MNLKFPFFWVLLLATFVELPAQSVITIAGVLETPGCVDGLLDEALFNNPHGIAVDQQGNVYSADRYSHTIRKISPEGVVTTLAGLKDQSGDVDGLGNQALFNEPWGLCVDASGNVFVADTRNNKIRKISPDGLVSTYAGTGNFGTGNGPSGNATFGNPTGIEIASDGNLYVADHLTHIIRKITNSGIVSTLAGVPYSPGNDNGIGSQARFFRPYGLTLDLEENILVADEWNHQIRKISPEGNTTTIAGTGQVGFNDGPGASAQFNYPWDLSVDSFGNIYVVDGYNYVIRKINPANEVSQIAGTLATTGGADGPADQATFSGATAIAFSPYSGELFIGDAYNHLIRKLILPENGIQLYINGGTTFCLGDTIRTSVQPAGLDSYTFYLDGSIIQTSNNNQIHFPVFNPGTYSMYATAETGESSLVTPSLSFTADAGPDAVISVQGNTTFFEGDSCILISNFADQYQWSTGSTEPILTVYEAGTYSLSIANDQACSGAADQIQITSIPVQTNPIISLSGDANPCFGETVILSTNFEDNIQWFLDGWPISEAVVQDISVSESGVYQVQFINSEGLVVISDPLDIQFKDALELNFISSNVNVQILESIQLEASSSESGTFSWDLGDGSQKTGRSISHNYATPGVYDIKLLFESSSGCTEQIIRNQFIEVSESIVSEDSDFVIPNAFTPNNDGINDVFRINGPSLSKSQLSIFNSWGNLVFNSSSNQAWDGSFQGLPAECGTYTFLLLYQDAGQQQIRTGHIQLFR